MAEWVHDEYTGIFTEGLKLCILNIDIKNTVHP